MHGSKAFFALVVLPFLASCGNQEAGPDVDPMLGRTCFAEQQPSLPPGTQYEGIESATGGRIRIRIMNGVEVTTVECELKTH